jgi:hypothetical protein
MGMPKALAPPMSNWQAAIRRSGSKRTGTNFSCTSTTNNATLSGCNRRTVHHRPAKLAFRFADATLQSWHGGMMDGETSLAFRLGQKGHRGVRQRLAGVGLRVGLHGRTARLLRESGLPVTEVREVTGFPEILNGRVKTIHPFIAAGILARRDVAAHLRELEQLGIAPIDLVVVNLYPFREVVQKGVGRTDGVGAH